MGILKVEDQRVLDKCLVAIQKCQTIENVHSMAFILINDFWHDNVMRDLTDRDKSEGVSYILAQCNKRIAELQKEHDDKPFRTIPADILKRRKEVEKLLFPTDYRYWYFYGDHKDFMDWFHERIEECYRTYDLTMLACTVRDEFNKGLNKEIAKQALDKLYALDKQYGLTILETVVGLD